MERALIHLHATIRRRRRIVKMIIYYCTSFIWRILSFQIWIQSRIYRANSVNICLQVWNIWTLVGPFETAWESTAEMYKASDGTSNVSQWARLTEDAHHHVCMYPLSSDRRRISAPYSYPALFTNSVCIQAYWPALRPFEPNSGLSINCYI